MSSLRLLKNRPVRNQNGSLAVLLPCAILLAAVGLGAFAIDVNHNITVRTELQSATDAAALGGGMSLLKTTTESRAYDDALSVAQVNTADGKNVTNSESGFEVLPTQEGWDASTNSCKFTVDATKTINNMFAKLFHHNTDDIGAHSTAQTWRSVTGVAANQAILPITVSLDTIVGHTQPLYKNKTGDVVNFSINSQQFKNAAFTSFTIKSANANYLTDMIDFALGLGPLPQGGIPPMNVGDTIYLTNGVAEQKQMAKGEYLSGLTDPDKTFLIPVIKGDPPYNQTQQIVGFLTVKFKKIKINGSGGQVEDMDMELVKGMIKGTGGIPNTGNGTADPGMKDLSPGTIKLVS